MAKTTTFKWNGDKFKKEFRDAQMKTISQGVDLIARKAQVICPAREGKARDSIKPRMNTKGKVEGYVYAGGKDAPHFHLFEFGTVKMQAQPTLRPTFDENVGKIKADFKKNCQAVVK